MRKGHNPSTKLSSSELLMKTVGQSSRLASKEQLHKYILEGRNCRNVQEFFNERQSWKDPGNRKDVLNKKMLVVKGKLLFSEIYEYREGSRFFGNDWCMGPFYSYDHNEHQIRK